MALARKQILKLLWLQAVRQLHCLLLSGESLLEEGSEQHTSVAAVCTLGHVSISDGTGAGTWYLDAMSGVLSALPGNLQDQQTTTMWYLIMRSVAR